MLTINGTEKSSKFNYFNYRLYEEIEHERLVEEGKCSKGLRVDTWKIYDENGQVKEKRYVDGVACPYFKNKQNEGKLIANLT